MVEAARDAVGPNGVVKVLSFDPHPLSILRPQSVPPRLTTFEQRTEFLRRVGADEVLPLVPSHDLLSRGAEDFIRWLAECHDPAFIVEGSDFHFGRGRRGSIETLRSHEAAYGYRTIVVDGVEVTLTDQSIVRASSSVTRWLLRQGRVRDAGSVLGRRYELRCPVRCGDRRGRTIDMPTANLDHGEQLLPADGIYAGIAERPDGRTYPAAISIGTKPTFGKHPRVCEVHLIGYDGPVDDYDWTIRLEFIDWIRDQLFYSDIEALKAQLKRDLDVTLRLIHAEPQLV